VIGDAGKRGIHAVLWGLDSRHDGRPVRTRPFGVTKTVLTVPRRKQYNNFINKY